MGAYYKKLAFVDNVIIETPLGFLWNYCVTALCTRSEVAAHHGGSWCTVELLNETSLNELKIQIIENRHFDEAVNLKQMKAATQPDKLGY